MPIPRGLIYFMWNKPNLLYANSFIRNPLALTTAVSINNAQIRSYKGSNRYKRSKARKDQLKLEKELESKYGIKSKPDFDKKAWFKENYFKELESFQQRSGIVFNNKNLLVSAFTHLSFINELNRLPKKQSGNEENEDLNNRLKILSQMSDTTGEKLSLLGYSVVLKIIKEGLYKRYSNLTSGICADIISYLTSHENINLLAKNLAIDELILLSKELENNNINDEVHLKFTIEDVVNDTFFAVIGAIWKDLGKDAADSFVKDFLLTLVDYEDLANHVKLEDPYSELMKILSMHGVDGITRARTIAETGVDTHFPFFHVGIYCNGYEIARGAGYSARTARIDAFKNSVFSCLENEVDFQLLKKSKKLLRS